MNFATVLKDASPHERIGLITARYEKNRSLFQKIFPNIDSLLNKLDCPYSFTITDSFIDIVNTPANTLAHPVNLDEFMFALARPNHGAWRELVNFEPVHINDSPIHSDFVTTFSSRLAEGFPHINEQFEKGKTRIGTAGAENKILPPTVFLGIFYGLHIDILVEEYDIPRLLLVEPDPARFEVSLYFLDYEELYRKYDQLHISIGPEIQQNVLTDFHAPYTVSSCLWQRVLMAYDYEGMDNLIQQLQIHQKSLEGLTTSFDREFEAFSFGTHNVEKKLPILSNKPHLTSESKIAVVASGPSLTDSFDWLRKNQNDLILFAVHSSVTPLKKAGITPDFQVSIESHLKPEQLENLKLDKSIPFLSNYKASNLILGGFSEPLLVSERDLPNVVNFSMQLADTGPSTTSLATAFSFFCNPTELYLVGVDVGFKNEEKKFISGGIHEKNMRMKNKFGDLFKVDANFFETGTVFTNNFFYKVKQAIEYQIEKYPAIKVYNVSDGARINGAAPYYKSNDTFKCYNKVVDIEKIKSCFSVADKHSNYKEYEVNFADLFFAFTKELEDQLVKEDFSFSRFTKDIDTVYANIVNSNILQSRCLRLVIVERLIIDILVVWYRYMLLAGSPQEAEKIFLSGCKAFKEFIEVLRVKTESMAVNSCV